MRALVLLAALYSSISYCATEYEPPQQYDIPEKLILEAQLQGCESVVCKAVIEQEAVPKPGDFPEREGNKTLNAIASAVYILGELGLAQN